MNIDDLINKVQNTTSAPSSFLKLLFETEKKLHYINGVRYRPPGFYEITDYSELYVLGDLHGDIDTLIEFIEKSKVLDKLEDNIGLKILFLGDYVDRGSNQVELLTTILLLKNTYPDNFILLRGNHEPPPFLLPHPHDLPQYLFFKFNQYVDEIYGYTMRFFQRLAFGARILGKILFLHGGPPSLVLKYKSFEEAFSIGKPCVSDSVIEEILWNDPVEYIDIPFIESPRGAGVHFSEVVTNRAVKLACVKYIIRGHEAVNGYKVNHSNRLVTIFDSKIEPYGFSRAAYLYINRDDLLNNIVDHIYLF